MAQMERTRARARACPEDEAEPSIGEAMRRLRDLGDADRPSVGEIVARLGDQSFGYLLLVTSAIVVTPLSGIPALSAVCGVTIALVAIQMIVGRSHAWLPGWIMRRTVARTRLDKALDVLDRPLRLIERLTRRRLDWVLRRPFVLVLQATCVLCGCAMPFLEFLPFTASIMASAVMLIAVSLVVRDGLFGLIGLSVVAAGVTGIAALVTGVLA